MSDLATPETKIAQKTPEISEFTLSGRGKYVVSTG